MTELILPGVMPWDDFEKRPEFTKCLAKQRAWLRAYVETGDEVAAVLAAFNCRNRKNAQILSYAVQRSRRVQAALSLYFGRTPRDVLLGEVEYHLRRAEPGSVAASRLLAQKERLLLPGPTAPPEEPETQAPQPGAVLQPAIGDTPTQKFFVGMRVTERDEKGVLHVGKVITIDASGEPTIEEIES